MGVAQHACVIQIINRVGQVLQVLPPWSTALGQLQQSVAQAPGLGENLQNGQPLGTAMKIALSRAHKQPGIAGDVNLKLGQTNQLGSGGQGERHPGRFSFDLRKSWASPIVARLQVIWERETNCRR